MLGLLQSDNRPSANKIADADPDAETWAESETHEGCALFGYLEVLRRDILRDRRKDPTRHVHAWSSRHGPPRPRRTHRGNVTLPPQPRGTIQALEIRLKRPARQEQVSRAPGVLHVSPHSIRHSFDFSHVNSSHHIDHLSFGLELSARERERLPEEASVSASISAIISANISAEDWHAALFRAHVTRCATHALKTQVSK